MKRLQNKKSKINKHNNFWKYCRTAIKKLLNSYLSFLSFITTRLFLSAAAHFSMIDRTLLSCSIVLLGMGSLDRVSIICNKQNIAINKTIMEKKISNYSTSYLNVTKIFPLNLIHQPTINLQLTLTAHFFTRICSRGWHPKYNINFFQ